MEVRWPSAEDRPFELRAVYRWAAPDTLDLETSVQAKTNLAKFESFLASYFCRVLHEFVRLCALKQPGMARGGGQECTVSGRHSRATTRRSSIIQDGRWKFPPNPVDWVIRPRLAKPLGVRRCPANDLRAVLMSPPQDCFAVLTPFEAEPHRSMYLSLFGKDLKAGETARARARLVIGSNLSGRDH